MAENDFMRAAGVIERSLVALTLADLEAEDCPLVRTNARFAALTGYRVEEVEGKNCRFLQRPPVAGSHGPRPGENEAARHDMRLALERREELQVILRNYRKDGTPFDNLLFMHPVNISGHAYMLGSQFELTQPAKVLAAAHVHVSALADDLARIAEKTDRLQMSHRRHLAETAAFLVNRWAG